MSKKVDLMESELEGMEIVDLGDASEETKQFAPVIEVPDSLFGWGLFCEHC
jgi:hypothetical protein